MCDSTQTFQNWSSKNPKMFETIFLCQGTKFRAETTSVSEISVAMQQDALLFFWPTYLALSLFGSILLIADYHKYTSGLKL